MAPGKHIAFKTIPVGPWDGPAADGIDTAHTVMVTRGFVMRETRIAVGRGAIQLFGPDDALPTQQPLDEQRGQITWLVLNELRIGVLHLEQFLESPDRAIAARLVQRMSRQLDHAAHQLAIQQLPRVEDRLTALYWQFAKRWGRATPDGLLVEMDLRHEVIGQLVGSRRSTVSVGLAALSRRGVLREAPRGMVLALQGDPDGEYAWLTEPVRDAVA
jgi:hypothetical protein